MYMNNTQSNMIRAGLRQVQHALDDIERRLHNRSVAVTHGHIENVIANLKCEVERLETYDPSLAPPPTGCPHGSDSDDCPDCRH